MSEEVVALKRHPPGSPELSKASGPRGGEPVPRVGSTLTVRARSASWLG